MHNVMNAIDFHSCLNLTGMTRWPKAAIMVNRLSLGLLKT